MVDDWFGDHTTQHIGDCHNLWMYIFMIYILVGQEPLVNHDQMEWWFCCACLLPKCPRNLPLARPFLSLSIAPWKFCRHEMMSECGSKTRGLSKKPWMVQVEEHLCGALSDVEHRSLEFAKSNNALSGHGRWILLSECCFPNSTHTNMTCIICMAHVQCCVCLVALDCLFMGLHPTYNLSSFDLYRLLAADDHLYLFSLSKHLNL